MKHLKAHLAEHPMNPKYLAAEISQRFSLSCLAVAFGNVRIRMSIFGMSILIIWVIRA